RPAASVALTATARSPAGPVSSTSACQPTHAQASSCVDSFAGIQVLPPSVVASTEATACSPAQATPLRVSGPRCTRAPAAGDTIKDRGSRDCTTLCTAPSSDLYVYRADCQNPPKPAPFAVCRRRGHFTHQTPNQPGTTRRTGPPCSGSRGSPFICQASRVSSASAFSRGRPFENSEFTFSGCAVPESEPMTTRVSKPAVRPAAPSTSDSRAPVQTAVPTSPLPNWVPGFTPGRCPRLRPAHSRSAVTERWGRAWMASRSSDLQGPSPAQTSRL